MTDGDGVRDNSRTGKFPRSELEPRLEAERKKRKTKSECPENDISSTTGIMKVYTEPADDSAIGDEDKPVE